MRSKRYLTINCIIRKNQIETTRSQWVGHDETQKHDVPTIRKLEQMIRQGFPEARITWAFSWGALMDQSERYQQIRALIKEWHETLGDEITFIPGGYFSNRYNTRDQINQDFTEAFNVIEKWIGHRPKSVVAGFLAAENLKYLAEKEDVHVVQGNIWSQYAIDNQDGDGSIAYPYYPSTEHFCKAAQGPQDFIDCVNLDGWTVNFFHARIYGKKGKWNNSRVGIGPIETLQNLGPTDGLKELQVNTNAHFVESMPYNPFTWLTVAIEAALVHEIPSLSKITDWLRWMKQQWPDTVCPTMLEFGSEFRQQYPNNDTISYELHQSGSGMGPAKKGEEIIWFMNKTFRLGIHRNKRGKQTIFDFTRYSQHYSEPQKLGERNWGLVDLINQKGIRKQDKPIPVEKCLWKSEINEILMKKYNKTI